MKQGFSIVLALLSFCTASFAQTEASVRPAPELSFVLPEAGQKSLSHFKGKVVALEFILTTCVHCQAASRLMTELQKEYGSRGFQALDLAINGLDEGRDAKAAEDLVAKFTRDFQVGFPVGYVERDKMPAFMGFSMMQRTVVPQLVLIDRQGMIHYQTPPGGDSQAVQESTIRQRVQELLALSSTLSKPKPSVTHKRT